MLESLGVLVTWVAALLHLHDLRLLLRVRTRPFLHNCVQSISWIMTNIRSVMNKLDCFQAFVSLHSPDIICVTESWLCSSTPSSLLSLPNYLSFRYDRPTRGGGVIVLINRLFKVIPVVIPDTHSNIEVVCLDVLLSTTYTRIIAYYRPPG